MNKLNLGCGNNYKTGWINVDVGSCKTDISHDLESIPYPFEDNFANAILMQHVMEHISKESFVNVVRELYRISANDCYIKIASPYAMSDNFFTDPTHKMPLTTRTFDYFDKTKPLHENGIIYGWGDIDLYVESANILDNPPNGPDIEYIIKVNK